MRLTRSNLRRFALIGAAAGLLLGGTLMSPATAADKSEAALSATDQVSSLATTVADLLGDRSAGSYLDANGALIVTVTDQAAADEVRKAGAVPQLVTRSAAQLAAVMADLDRSAAIPGTAWAVDPMTNQVLISVDTSVTGADLRKLNAVVRRLGDAVRVEHVPGTFSTNISGGDAIYAGGGGRCSLGFNVRSGSGTEYFLTAGHCTNISASWYANSAQTTVLGTRAGTSFPGNDYGIVRYTSSISRPGTVGGQDITSAGTPVVNQTVTRRGSTTGTHSGRVTALNATVNYAQGSVFGMIRTTVCAEPGDSGGSLYSGSTAYGLTSGGNGNCTFGGTTYFQPVVEALNVYGVSVY